MSWHPPIPAGKLYSPPALQLGAGIAMLVWCYDGIQKDGTIEISLERAADDLRVSYRTIKDWWKVLRAGPFFCEQFDRGRRGYVVRMAEDWIDWHVMGNNYPGSQSGQGQKIALEDTDDSASRPGEGQNSALENVQGPVKARSRPGEGQNSALETSAYKEDQHDHESWGSGARKRADSRAPPTLDQLHEGVTAYKRLTGKRTVTPTVAAQIAETVTDIPRWETVITAWCGKYRSENVSGMLDWYQHPEKMNSNGTHQTGRLPTTDRRPGLAVRRTRERLDLDEDE